MSGNPLFSSEPVTLHFRFNLSEVKADIFDPEGRHCLMRNCKSCFYQKILPSSIIILLSRLSLSTTSSSLVSQLPKISDYSLEEFADATSLLLSHFRKEMLTWTPGETSITYETLLLDYSSPSRYDDGR
ncbi:hypothetical protein Tco_0502503 [Tanacetum coccineum]